MSAVWNRIKYTSNECAWEWRILDTGLPLSFVELFRSRTTIHVKAGLAVPVRGSARRVWLSMCVQCDLCDPPIFYTGGSFINSVIFRNSHRIYVHI